MLVPVLIPQPTKLTVTGTCTKLRWDGDDVANEFVTTPSAGTHELACEGGSIDSIAFDLL